MTKEPEPPAVSALSTNRAEARALPDGIRDQILQLARQQGFEDIGISQAAIDRHATRYPQWLERNYHGEMGYMARNVEKRLDPPRLVPDSLSIICLRMNYLPASSEQARRLLDHPGKAYVSRYALGRDYHKLIRKRLQKVARALAGLIGDFGYRVFTDSAPVLERTLAVQAGLGWRGKHSCLLTRDRGSWFFLGEIFTDLPLPPDRPLADHCGDCRACIDACPTAAIVEPRLVDARRCISYLTIEHHSAIPVELRSAIGNRIYGCDDCQLFCPWNRFEQISPIADFQPRHGLDDISLLELFAWTGRQFLDRFEGSPIRRIGYARWRRNLAVALGNAAADPHILHALEQALPGADELVAEHLSWAIDQQQRKLAETRP
jgi:epoxyqueuosine reductase